MGSVTFTKVDVQDYNAQLNFVDVAFKYHGRVDMAVYCVGISDPPGWMGKASLNLETVKNVLDGIGKTRKIAN